MKTTSVKFIQGENRVLYHDLLVLFQTTSYFFPVILTHFVNVMGEFGICLKIWSDLLHSSHGEVHLSDQILTFTLSEKPGLICRVI